MPARKDARRYSLGELIENLLKDNDSIWLENSKVELEDVGHVTVTYHPDAARAVIYDIKVSRRSR